MAISTGGLFAVHEGSGDDRPGRLPSFRSYHGNCSSVRVATAQLAPPNPHTTTAGLCLPAETGRRRLRVYLLVNLGGYPSFSNRKLHELGVCFEA
jgi:hypothetical protein